MTKKIISKLIAVALSVAIAFASVDMQAFAEGVPEGTEEGVSETSEITDAEVVIEENDVENIGDETSLNKNDEEENTEIKETSEEALGAALLNISNPRIVADDTMEAKQKVTYDCIWFGSYPQTEIVLSGSAEEAALVKMNENFTTKYETFPASEFSKITSATYDTNGDATVSLSTGDIKVRRINKTSATYSTEHSSYYQWSDSTSYHYFRYDPIKWRVLSVDGDNALILADNALDDKKYNDTYISVTWEKSTLRSWLNSTFYDTAFTEYQKAAINITNVTNKKNLSGGIAGGGNATADNIFLLSESEVYSTDLAASYGFVKSSSTHDEARRIQPSTYAFAMGTYRPDYAGNCYWWLRSPGRNTLYATQVYSNGNVNNYGNSVANNDYGICPALNLNLSSLSDENYAGTICTDGTVNETARPEIDINDYEEPIGIDTWSFMNSSTYYCDSKNELNSGYYITKADSDRLVKNLPNTEKYNVLLNLDKFIKSEQDSAGNITNYYISRYNVDGKNAYQNVDQWGGSCYGMASIVAAVNNKQLSPESDLKLGKTLNTIINSGGASRNYSAVSAINYYFTQQFLTDVDRIESEFSGLDQLTQLKTLESIVPGKVAIVSFFWNEGEEVYGHAINAYGVENLASGKEYSVTKANNTYVFNKKVKVYDNANKDTVIYYNDKGEVYIYGYDVMSINTNRTWNSNNNGEFGIITADPNYINAINYVDGKLNYTSSVSTDACLTLGNGTFDISYGSKKISVSDGLIGENAGDNSLNIIPVMNGEAASEYKMFLPYSKEYIVNAKNKLNIAINSNGYLETAYSENPATAVIGTDGKVHIEQQNAGECAVSVVADDNTNASAWDMITVQSSASKTIDSSLKNKSVIVNGDNLSDVNIITAVDDKETVHHVSVTQKSVELKDNNGELEVFIDKDGDGKYETEVGSEPTDVPGDKPGDKPGDDLMNVVELGTTGYKLVYAKTVSYNTLQHAEIGGKLSKTKVNDVYVKMLDPEGNEVDASRYTVKFKNSKDTYAKTKKNPSISIALKGKTWGAATKKMFTPLSKVQHTFDIEPMNFSSIKASAKSVKSNNKGVWKINGLSFINSAGKKVNLKEANAKGVGDYKILEVTDENIVIQGIMNYTGKLLVNKTTGVCTVVK